MKENNKITLKEKIDRINAIAKEYCSLSEEGNSSRKKMLKMEIWEKVFALFNQEGDKMWFLDKVYDYDTVMDAIIYAIDKYVFSPNGDGSSQKEYASFFTFFMNKLKFKQKDVYRKKSKENDRITDYDFNGSDEEDKVSSWLDIIGEEDSGYQQINDTDAIAVFYNYVFDMYKGAQNTGKKTNVKFFAVYTHKLINAYCGSAVNAAINKMSEKILVPSDKGYINQMTTIRKGGPSEMIEFSSADFSRFARDNDLVQKSPRMLFDRALGVYLQVDKSTVSRAIKSFDNVFIGVLQR